MKLTFLGTGAAEGFPAPWCECDICRQAAARGGREIRRRCAYLLDDDTLIDYGPDIQEQIRLFLVNLHRVKRVLITHSHYDHLAPMEFLWRRSPCFSQVSRSIKVFGAAESLAMILECTARDSAILSLDELQIEPRLMASGVPVADGDLEILPLAADHQYGRHALLYLLSRGGKSLLIANDTGFLPEKSWQLLAGRHADCVAVDCTFALADSGQRNGHMGCAAVVAFRDKLQEMGVIAARTPIYATHISHNGQATHADLERFFAPHNIHVACDGMTCELN